MVGLCIKCWPLLVRNRAIDPDRLDLWRLPPGERANEADDFGVLSARFFGDGLVTNR